MSFPSSQSLFHALPSDPILPSKLLLLPELPFPSLQLRLFVSSFFPRQSLPSSLPISPRRLSVPPCSSSLGSPSSLRQTQIPTIVISSLTGSSSSFPLIFFCAARSSLTLKLTLFASIRPNRTTVSGACNTRETVLKRDGTGVVVSSACAVSSSSMSSEFDASGSPLFLRLLISFPSSSFSFFAARPLPEPGSLPTYVSQLLFLPPPSHLSRSRTILSFRIFQDGATWTAASDVDIDHMVPLSEAWASGASAWTTAQRQAFANDLVRPQLFGEFTSTKDGVFFELRRASSDFGLVFRVDMC